VRTNRRNDAAATVDAPAQPPIGAPIGRPVKLSERIAAALVSDIVAAGLGPGDRLPNEAAMLERFQVGRASLREALRILEVYGLISLRSGPGGGPVVTAADAHNVARAFSLYLHVSQARIGDLVEARMFIEPMVARMAAENRDPDALRRLEQAMAEEASIPDHDDAYVAAANNFHYAVTTMTGNAVVDLVATALKELYTTRFVSAGLASQTTEPTTIRNEHREIGEAILAGDADTAERLMREHMRIYVQRMAAAAPALTDEIITWG
jgi:GntR family transcriptional repressor for pyruvate dehydrogenase complex